jgi:hypothetical protein
MKLSNSKQLPFEDFSDQRPWIEKLLGPLNTFFLDVTNILNNGLVFSDNVKGQRHEVRLNAGVSTFSFRWNPKQAPFSISIAQVFEIGTQTVPALGMRWIYDDGTVQVALTGLDGTKEYRLILRGEC